MSGPVFAPCGARGGDQNVATAAFRLLSPLFYRPRRASHLLLPRISPPSELALWIVVGWLDRCAPWVYNAPLSYGRKMAPRACCCVCPDEEPYIEAE
jgi:hypothetical protein